MERELFDWESWDRANEMHLQFYNCVLKKDLKEHKSGTKISVIDINFGTGVMTLWDDTGTIEIETVQLRLEF